MSDGYRRNRVWYQDESGGFQVTVLTGTTTLAVHRDTNTIYVQRVHVQITSGLGVTWSVQGSDGLVIIATIDASKVGPQDFDFGAWGVPLTVATDLVLVPSAGGAAGSITWDAYQRLAPGTAVSIAQSAAAV